jgi:hypothetical protein
MPAVQEFPVDRPLSKKQEAAALAVAEDRLTDREIADAAGITVWALDKWKRRPDFRARIDEHRAHWREEIAAQGIANKQNRIAAYNADWQRLEQVILARAADPLMAGVAGGDTGLLVATPILVRVYETSDEDDEDLKPLKRQVMTYEYAVDTGLLRERRELAKQAATELGEWTEKKELTGAGGAALIPEERQPFDYEHFSRAFAGFLGAPSPAPPGGAGPAEPLDPTDPDGAAGDLLRAAGP